VKLKIRYIFALISILIIFALATNLVANTYSLQNGEGLSRLNTQIAIWNVSFLANDEAIEKDFDLVFDFTNPKGISKNKIAPGQQGEAKVTLNMAGSEVACDYSVLLNEDLLDETFSGLNFKLEITNENGDEIIPNRPYLVNLTNQQEIKNKDGHINLYFKLIWDFSEDDEISKKDTVLALTKNDFKLPIKIRIAQHLDRSKNRTKSNTAGNSVKLENNTESKTEVDSILNLEDKEILDGELQSGEVVQDEKSQSEELFLEKQLQGDEIVQEKQSQSDEIVQEKQSQSGETLQEEEINSKELIKEEKLQSGEVS